LHYKTYLNFMVVSELRLYPNEMEMLSDYIL